MTLRDVLDQAAEGDPARPYLFFGDEVVTVGDLVQRVDALAAALLALGVRRGDHVAVVLPNRPEFLYAWFALASLGAVIVPLNPALTSRELQEILRHSDAAGLIADGRLEGVLASAVRGSAVRWVATTDPHAADDRVPPGRAPECAVPDGGLPEAAAPAGAASPGSAHSPDAGAAPERHVLGELLAGPARRPPSGPRGDEAIAALVYTSGTTGAPRGVLKTHRSYVRVAREVTRWVQASPADRFFTCLPLFHTHAQVYAVLPSLACGGSLVLAERFSASRFWDAVAASGATLFTYLGTMLAILARTPPSPAERRHRVRAAIGGGATAELERTCVRRFGVPLVELYALTETSTVTVRPLAAVGSSGSAGWPASYCDVRILDDAGQVCLPGVVGEIAVSPSEVMMAGYYREPAATAAAFRAGWFLTGDLGWRDGRGALYFAGRKRERIRRRGEWVAPAEVEAVLASHPAVAEAAVVGRPSELGDEEVCAVVVPIAGARITAEALQRFCQPRLAPFKVPTLFEFRTELPKTSTQKVRRELLRQAGAAPWDRGEALRESGATLPDQRGALHEPGAAAGDQDAALHKVGAAPGEAAAADGEALRLAARRACDSLRRPAPPVADGGAPRPDARCASADGLGTAALEGRRSTGNGPEPSATAPAAGSALLFGAARLRLVEEPSATAPAAGSAPAPNPPAPDDGAGADTRRDAALDAGREFAFDVTRDAALRAGRDAAADAGCDVAVDAGSNDALDADRNAARNGSRDARRDAALAAGCDAALDAGRDAALGSGCDAALDAGRDAALAAGRDTASGAAAGVLPAGSDLEDARA